MYLRMSGWTGVVFAVICVENPVWRAVVMDTGLHVHWWSTGNRIYYYYIHTNGFFSRTAWV